MPALQAAQRVMLASVMAYFTHQRRLREERNRPVLQLGFDLSAYRRLGAVGHKVLAIEVGERRIFALGSFPKILRPVRKHFKSFAKFSVLGRDSALGIANE